MKRLWRLVEPEILSVALFGSIALAVVLTNPHVVDAASNPRVFDIFWWLR